MDPQLPQHLLSWRDSSTELWQRCLADTLRFADGLKVPALEKHVGLLFMNPSLRTRASMEVAAGRLGCRVTTLTGQDAWQIEWNDGAVMNGDKAEHVREAAVVLSGYFDLIGVRSFAPLPNAADELSDTAIARLARHSTVPVVNLESAVFHPCQALADAAVMTQHLDGDVAGSRFVLSWAYHPRALPLAVPQSALLMAARLGAHVTVACPPGFLLPDRIMAEAAVLARQHGGSVEASHDLASAADGAHVIYAKSWTPHDLADTPDGGAAVRDRYQDWRISEDLMRTTDRGAFMHCLPVRRNVIVDDAVLDGPSSLVARQARMRVDANAAIITALLGATP